MHILFDDIILAGKDVAEHDRILLQVLERANANGIKFNAEISVPDPDQVKAIVEYPS